MLELKGLSKHFGGVRAVDGLDLRVTQGEVFGLIGPNGSGKSTVVNLVCGLFPVTAGQVLLRNEDITSLASHVRVACGVTRTFQNIRLFGQLSVWQNLWVAQNAVEHRSEGFLRRWLGGPLISLADIACAAHLSIADYLGGVDWRGHEETRQWYSGMKSRRSLRVVLADRMELVSPPEHYEKPDF